MVRALQRCLKALAFSSRASYTAVRSPAAAGHSSAVNALQAHMSLRHAIALRRTMHGVTSFEAEMGRPQNKSMEAGLTPQEALAADEGFDLEEAMNLSNRDGSGNDSFGGEGWHKCVAFLFMRFPSKQPSWAHCCKLA